MVFQPVVELATGTLVGYEALARGEGVRAANALLTRRFGNHGPVKSHPPTPSSTSPATSGPVSGRDPKTSRALPTGNAQAAPLLLACFA